MGRIFNLFVPQLLHKSYDFTGILQGVSELLYIKRLEHCLAHTEYYVRFVIFVITVSQERTCEVIFSTLCLYSIPSLD